jgi:hypothetical protein
MKINHDIENIGGYLDVLGMCFFFRIAILISCDIILYNNFKREWLNAKACI